MQFLHYEIAVSLWGQKAECCGIDVKCLPYSRILDSWSMVGGAAYKAVESLGGSDLLEDINHWGKTMSFYRQALLLILSLLPDGHRAIS